MLTHEDLDVPDLCEKQRAVLRTLVGDGPFGPRAAAQAYLEAGYPWRDIVRAYQALVRAGRLPDVGLAWTIARIAFREAGQVHPVLAPYAETLGPDNWQEARARATAAGGNAAAAGAAAASAAAYADADAAAYAVRAAAAAAAYADAASAEAFAVAYQQVRVEVIELVIAEVERVLAQEG